MRSRVKVVSSLLVLLGPSFLSFTQKQDNSLGNHKLYNDINMNTINRNVSNNIRRDVIWFNPPPTSLCANSIISI